MPGVICTLFTNPLQRVTSSRGMSTVHPVSGGHVPASTPGPRATPLAPGSHEGSIRLGQFTLTPRDSSVDLRSKLIASRELSSIRDVGVDKSQHSLTRTVETPQAQESSEEDSLLRHVVGHFADS